jgi:two-component system, OmpR family, sensor histidine kinase TorS
VPDALVIDDHRETAEALRGMLGLLGYTVRLAFGPRPALEALAQRVPDVIFLDIHMHGLDGVEVCRYIRRDPRTARVTIIGISTDTQPDLIDRLRQAGADGFLAKPIDMDQLEDVRLALPR